MSTYAIGRYLLRASNFNNLIGILCRRNGINGCEGDEPEFYVRANVEAAEKLCKAAMHLMRCGPFFRDERAKFVPPSRTDGSTFDEDDHNEHPRSQHHCLLMLPTILYLPKTGEPVHPGVEAMDKMKRLYRSLTRGDAERRDKLVRLIAFRLASEPQVMEAFRYAARRIAWHYKRASMISFVTFVLRRAEEFAASHCNEE
jgi:hypothetical protein